MANSWVLGVIIITIIAILIVPNSYAKSLTFSPSSITIDYTQDATQPASSTITITNGDNDTFSISTSKTGDGIGFFNLSNSTFGFNGTESKSLIIAYGIPPNTFPKLYSSKVQIDGNAFEIPLFIVVKEKAISTTGCKILMPSEFARNIKKGTSPFTQEFILQISNQCANGLTITDIRESGQVTVTEQGLQPIKITGVVPKGNFNKGQTMPLSVEFDTSQLSLGDYKSQIIITSTDGNEDITQKMDFRIFVVGTASSVNNGTFSSLPSCSPSTTDLQVGKTYTMICNNVVDSNVKLTIDDDALDFIEGVSYDNPSNQIIWTFTPKKIGNAVLKTYFTYNGVPIGAVNKFDLRISQLLSGELGTKLKFDFYPKSLNIDTLKAGDTFSLLIKAINPNIENDTGVIIDNVVIYKNGQIQDTKTFVVNAGESFTLSASALGFSSIEKTINIPLNTISIGLPPDVEVNKIFSISLSPSDAIIKIDNKEVTPSNVNLSEIKIYTLTAERAGYTPITISFQVTPELKLVTPEKIPEKLSLGEEFFIEYNKPIDWYVLFSENRNGTLVTFTSGNSAKINFIPQDKGIYQLFVRGNKIAEFDKASWFSWTYFWWILSGLVAVFIIYRIIKTRNKSGYSEGERFSFDEEQL